MGADYALVHIHWNIPPAVILSFIYYPLLTALDVYKILFLIFIAVTATIPWDSYLIRNNVWSYPENAVLGPTLFDIPAEELFFFVIQTFNTSLLYLLLSKSTFHPVYLRGESQGRHLQIWKWTGGSVIAALIAIGVLMIQAHGEGFYMGLILTWAGPFALLLWMLAYQFILLLPLANTILPIVLPTLYLWLVDTLALRRGTWVIEAGTKLSWQVWEGLEIEEAVFFFATNTLIVFGLVAFDNAVAILVAFPSIFPTIPSLPSPKVLVEALLVPTSAYDEYRITGLKQAVLRLQKKSRSFSIASGIFPGRVRSDLILLYSFCRAADDLVDDSEWADKARNWINKLRKFLDLAYSPKTDAATLDEFIMNSFPTSTHSALRLLPTSHMPSAPLYSLLDGFEMDLEFQEGKYPVGSDSDLELYAARVAGTVAELCIRLVYHYSPSTIQANDLVVKSGERMGIALQLVNIARDIGTDARISRVYIPTERLKKHGLTPEAIIHAFKANGLSSDMDAKIEALRRELLEWAFKLYHETRAQIEELPAESRGGVRVMVESYTEIGRVMLEEARPGKDWGNGGKATVGVWRRMIVAWKALLGV